MNSKYEFTISNKLKNCSMLLDYVYEKVLNNSEIRRMVYYDTRNPLDDIGVGFDGKTMQQKEVSVKQVREKELISPLGFTLDIDPELKTAIYFNMPKGNFSYNHMLYLDVNILCPTQYIITSTGRRDFEIGQMIANELDKLCVENEFSEDVGNVEFELVDFENTRLSKTNSVMWLRCRYKIGLVPIDRVVSHD